MKEGLAGCKEVSQSLLAVAGEGGRGKADFRELCGSIVEIVLEMVADPLARQSPQPRGGVARRPLAAGKPKLLPFGLTWLLGKPSSLSPSILTRLSSEVSGCFSPCLIAVW